MWAMYNSSIPGNLDASVGGAGSNTESDSGLTGPMWDALLWDTASAVVITDVDGKILQANKPACFLLGAGACGVGRSLREFWSADVVAERLTHAKAAVASGRPVVVEGLIGGVWHRTTTRPVRLSAGGMGVLMVMSSGTQLPPPEEGVAVLRARVDDPGPLGLLTDREIEILRLIGDGLSTAEIARELHRSVKTIEWHRVSLGSKLKATNRVGLARIAIQAGLSRLNTGPAAEIK